MPPLTTHCIPLNHIHHSQAQHSSALQSHTRLARANQQQRRRQVSRHLLSTQQQSISNSRVITMARDTTAAPAAADGDLEQPLVAQNNGAAERTASGFHPDDDDEHVHYSHRAPWRECLMCGCCFCCCCCGNRPCDHACATGWQRQKREKQQRELHHHMFDSLAVLCILWLYNASLLHAHCVTPPPPPPSRCALVAFTTSCHHIMQCVRLCWEPTMASCLWPL